MRHRVAAVVGVLLVAAAALLVLGVLLERRTESGTEHPVVAATGEQQESHHHESTEGASAEPGTAPANRGVETAERLTGISVESPWVVAVGAVVSVTPWRWRRLRGLAESVSWECDEAMMCHPSLSE